MTAVHLGANLIFPMASLNPFALLRLAAWPILWAGKTNGSAGYALLASLEQLKVRFWGTTVCSFAFHGRTSRSFQTSP